MVSVVHPAGLDCLVHRFDVFAPLFDVRSEDSSITVKVREGPRRGWRTQEDVDSLRDQAIDFAFDIGRLGPYAA